MTLWGVKGLYSSFGLDAGTEKVGESISVRAERVASEGEDELS